MTSTDLYGRHRKAPDSWGLYVHIKANQALVSARVNFVGTKSAAAGAGSRSVRTMAGGSLHSMLLSRVPSSIPPGRPLLATACGGRLQGRGACRGIAAAQRSGGENPPLAAGARTWCVQASYLDFLLSCVLSFPFSTRAIRVRGVHQRSECSRSCKALFAAAKPGG